MPRRPRPTHRRPGVSAHVQENAPAKAKDRTNSTNQTTVKGSNHNSGHSLRVQPEEDDEDEDDDEEAEADSSDASDPEDDNGEEDDEDEMPDADMPRVAQWVPDDELDEDGGSSEDEDDAPQIEREPEDESTLVRLCTCHLTKVSAYSCVHVYA